MVTVYVLSFCVVMSMTVNAGPMDTFRNWQIVFKCPRTFVSSYFDYFAPKVNHVQVLLDIEALDKDHNDDITRTELADWSSLNLDLKSGVARCDYMKTFVARYGLKKTVTNTLFTDDDTNQDGIFTTSDVILPNLDTNGDGKHSVCEMYNVFLTRLKEAGRKDYEDKEKVRQIKANTDYYNKKPANDWSNVFWHFFRNSWN